MEGGLQTRSPMCTTYFKQHLRDLSGCDVSSTCTCTVSLRQQPFLKGTTFYIVLNCVYNLDQFQLLCKTTYHQYVYAAYSGSLSSRYDFPNITAHYYLPKQTFHIDCLPPDGQAIRASRNSRLWMMLLHPSQIINISGNVRTANGFYFSTNMFPFTALTRNKIKCTGV